MDFVTWGSGLELAADQFSEWTFCRRGFETDHGFVCFVYFVIDFVVADGLFAIFGLFCVLKI